MSALSVKCVKTFFCKPAAPRVAVLEMSAVTNLLQASFSISPVMNVIETELA